DYIEMFYNSKRRHGSSDQMSPTEYENQYYQRLGSVWIIRGDSILKIDGSFIRNIVSNSLDYQIVASICHLARMKNMQVVAEYVESEEIRSVVLSLGIDYLQGYLIGEPQLLSEIQ
ncbi:EAL domain-containing protein, partial [Salmonella enterica]|uniref:EAL domain-containing protein n=1 Tax=Salmonella enterica TaxID=28901 RepID=UPI003D221741